MLILFDQSDTLPLDSDWRGSHGPPAPGSTSVAPSGSQWLLIQSFGGAPSIRKRLDRIGGRIGGSDPPPSHRGRMICYIGAYMALYNVTQVL